MKLMSREFSFQEKVLMLVLTLFLMAGGYHFLIDEPLNAAISQSQMRREDMQMQVNLAQTQLARLKNMKTEMDDAMDNSVLGIMGTYDNKKEELDFLNMTLSRAGAYSLRMEGVTRDGDLVRRAFQLQYTTGNYAQAAAILQDLTNCELRCLVGDVQMSTEAVQFGNAPVSVMLNAVFYETMEGSDTTAGLKAEKPGK